MNIFRSHFFKTKPLYKFRNVSSISSNVSRYSQTFRYQYDETLCNSRIKSFRDANKQLFDESKSNELDVQSILNCVIFSAKYGQNVTNFSVNNDAHNRFLNRVGANIDQMTVEDLVSALIALNLLKVPLHHPINCELIITLTRMLKSK